MSETTPSDGETADPPPEERKIRRALAQIRREGWKVAVIYAVVDATLATLLVNLVATVTGVPELPARLPLPDAVLSALRSAGVAPADPTVASGVVVGLAVGLVVFVSEVAWRVRRPLVEQFEAANPELREALRTARDTVNREGRSRMALRLYESVLDDLRAASSIGLLDLRRVAVTVVVVAAVSIATIQLAVVDVSLAGGVGGAPEAEPDGGTDTEYTGLEDGSSILGEPEDVPEGEENLDASVDTEGAGSGDVDTESAAAYDDSGFDDSGTVESQRAGFSERERLEDAELIREYNLRIREETDDS
ncbi:DUF7502 family protein [Haloplanus salilacus]|uniref:DUF7502 family protein n=1 Tax=Haloplanus salilacus TaxID=2949994 RepID=UPI0030CFC325